MHMCTKLMNIEFFSFVELSQASQNTRRKKKKKKKRKKGGKSGWNVVQVLRDHAVLAVKLKSSDPKKKDKWKTSFDKYMLSHSHHPEYHFPAKGGGGSGQGYSYGGGGEVGDHAVLSIAVDDFDALSSDDGSD